VTTSAFDLRETTLRGLRTAWLQGGVEGGPIALFLHGFPDAAGSWEAQLQHFAKTHTVVAPYMRGAGPSERPSRLKRYGRDAAALDILGVLEAVDPSKQKDVYIVGHDLGAVHAWHVADLLQKRVKGLAIINGLTLGQMARRWRRPKQLLKSWYIAAMQVPLLPEALVATFGRPLVAFAHAQGGLAPSRRPDFQAVRDALAGPLNQYRAFLRETPDALARDRRRLRCPVLVLWGKDDAFLVPPTRTELEAEATAVTVRILPGNHWLHRESPDKINRLLGEFFAR